MGESIMSMSKRNRRFLREIGQQRAAESMKELHEKDQYLVLGSDNFWYASCLNTLQEALEVIERVKANPTTFRNGDTNKPQQRAPQRFYVYKAVKIKEVYADDGTNADPTLDAVDALLNDVKNI
jgi:hypothetical protein